LLRVFKHGSTYLSTFEQNPADDPRHIRTVSNSDDKDDNLFPSKIGRPLHTSFLGFPSEEDSERGQYGYPICYSKEGYEWYPYLPAVVKFHYPIFKVMSRTPDILYDGSGYGLCNDEKIMWQNVEYVMIKTAQAIGSGQTVSLKHKTPPNPSVYGYTRSHANVKFAKKVILKSLNAFQRLLAYCSYCIAGAPSIDPLGEKHKRFYSGAFVSDLYKKLDPREPDLHILAKLLLSSMWQMRVTRNHTGVVVDYNSPYDYVAVNTMLSHNGPVYVSWPGPGKNPYTSFFQHHNLKDFYPTPEHFKALEGPPTPVVSTPTIRYGVPPTAKDPQIYDDPMDYIRQRLQRIPDELKRCSNEERRSMENRLAAARKFDNSKGSKYFRFEPFTVVDERTRQEENRWVRVELTKHDAAEDFENVEGRHLW
jgi:hypothetical protein